MHVMSTFEKKQTAQNVMYVHFWKNEIRKNIFCVYFSWLVQRVKDMLTTQKSAVVCYEWVKTLIEQPASEDDKKIDHRISAANQVAAAPTDAPNGEPVGVAASFALIG